MEWNVFYDNVNKGNIEYCNVLAGRDELINELKSKAASKEEFSDKLRLEMMCHYWSRAEWEIEVCPLCGCREEEGKKIDVFDQLSLNWDRFVDYCWDATSHEE